MLCMGNIDLVARRRKHISVVGQLQRLLDMGFLIGIGHGRGGFFF